MKFRELPAYIKIMIGMVTGILIGLVAIWLNGAEFVSNWIAPFGTIFIRLLKLIAIPLVLLSLIGGIGSLKDISKLAAIGGKTLILYIGFTVIAVVIGLSLALIVRPGDMVSAETSQNLLSTYSAMSQPIAATDSAVQSSPLTPLIDMIPDNAIGALANNGAMLQVILLALLIGVAAVMVGEDINRPFMEFVSSLDKIVLKIIDIIMSFAPIGIAALMAGMITDNAGDVTLLGALGLYMLTVIFGFALLLFVIYPLTVNAFTNIKAKQFIQAMIPVQIMGFSTSSSAATLATTMKMTDDVLHLPKKITSFTLPVGVTINMDGTSLYQAIAVVFIAQVMGIDLTMTQLLIIIATTTISSIGTPGVPGGSVVILMMVLSSVGIPAEGLALIMGVDRPLDMLRTSVNVTGDVVVSSVVSKSYSE